VCVTSPNINLDETVFKSVLYIMHNALKVKTITLAKHNGCIVNVQFLSEDLKYYNALFFYGKKTASAQ